MRFAATRVEGTSAGELEVRLRRGLELSIGGVPDPARVEAGPPVASVAVLGRDGVGARLEPRVAPGAHVRRGQALAVDRRRPQIHFTAPGAGVVRSIERGPRRRIEAIVVDLDGDSAERFDPVVASEVAELDRGRLETTMLASGLWTALRTRPFSRIPDPGSRPAAIFVTAMESEPLAPPAQTAIEERGDDFALGVLALTRLTEGPVFVCIAPGARPRLPTHERVRLARFAGPHPSGLPGTHIHTLAPVGLEATAWHVGYPDVIALGHLLVAGELLTERIVSLAGPAVGRPRLVRTRLGASTDDLVRGELEPERCRVLSGSVLSGRHALGWGAYLGRRHTQVCAIPEATEPGEPGWIVPARGGRARRVLDFARRRTSPVGATTALGGSRGVFFPLERFDRVVPLDLPIAPLLRALVVGDAESAADLGCLELAEEDLALVSFLCPGKLDYGGLLRSVLDDLEPKSA